MTDELDLVRAPVPVGVPPRPLTGHPAIDARTIVARPQRAPRVRAAPQPPLHPPDTLGVLDAETSRVLRPTEPPNGRRGCLAAAVAVGVVAIAVVPAVVVGLRDDDAPRTSGLVTGTTPPSSAPWNGTAEITAVRWGPDPGVCPAGDAPCYTVEVHLEGHRPGQRLDVACEVPDRPAPLGTTVRVDGNGLASARVACAANRAARSIAVTVDGETAATVDLPTTIVPTGTS